MKIRNMVDTVLNALALIGFVLLLLILCLILGTIILYGLPHISAKLFFTPPGSGFFMGGEGGVLNALLGSLLIATCSTLLASLIGIPLMLHVNIFIHSESLWSRGIRFCFNILWGIPSLIYGVFVFLFMVIIGLKASLGAGILAITLVILPVICRNIDEILKTVPIELIENGLALGTTKLELSMLIILRKIGPGVISAVLIGFGRAIGDAAAVLFTAGFTDALPSTLDRPVATLPLSIFFQLSSPFSSVRDKALGTALLLILIILVINIAIRFITHAMSIDHEP